MYTELRLRIRHFFKRNKKIIIIAVIVWLIIFIINNLLKRYQPPVELQTTYEPHKSVIDTASSVPTKTANSIEKMIAQYVEYCNNAEWSNAYNMLSDNCKKYSFDNNLHNFMDHVYKKMPTPKKYVIQDYSNDGNLYIYQVKYFDDFLATGLTNQDYYYTEEKLIFKMNDDNSIDMSIGDYINCQDIKNLFENEYIKIDVKSVMTYYKTEVYTVVFTNRSEYTIVVSNFNEENEIYLELNSGDKRYRKDQVEELILEPGQKQTIELEFQKYYDGADDSKLLGFNSIRVLEKYSGNEDDVTQEVIQNEIQNAIAKFNVSIPITYSK